MSQGKFITLEGGEGAGKSTQAALLRDRLQAAKLRVVMTREPGGSPRAETIRGILLSGQAKRFGPLAETVLFYVARDSHLELTVRPALARGAWVVCDRFFDSTRAYQGAAGGVSLAALDAFERAIVGATRPDLTIILDLPPEEGLRRAKARAEMAKDGAPDRFESMEIAFHNNLRQEFLDIAAVEPKRCALVDAARSIDAISADIWAVVKQRLNAV
ncbi:MAG: dTMP kinase [Hyphomicrobiales bacterium]|nr:dTMP kinase [Hyphomicrobiales bacterium]